MTAWYYSDPHRNRLGPVAASDLAALHEGGQLQPGTLVWREGLADWKPWHEVMDEVLGPRAPGALSLEPVAGATDDHRPAPIANDTPAAAVAGGYNPYEVVERVPASPYAPPTASVATLARVVHGGHVVYARFLKRFASNAVDGFVAGIAAYALLIPLVLAMGAGVGSMMDGGAAAGLGLGFIGLMYLVQFGVPAIYAGAMQSSGWQATLGKRLTETKLVRTDGSPVGFWRGFFRSIALILSIILTCGLGAIATAVMTVATDRRQGLHDLICDTVVVDRHAFTDEADYQDESLNTATKVVLGLYVLLILGGIVFVVLAGVLAGNAR
ncbi:RDD family protein [Lysobacter xanthus]